MNDPLSGQMPASDADASDTLTFTVQGSPSVVLTGMAPAVSYGTLTLNANGSYSFARVAAAINALGAGQSVTIAYTVQVTDGIVSDTDTLTFTITGSNDAPIIQTAAGLTGTVTERADGSATDNAAPAHSISNIITFTDAELGQTHSSTTVPFNSVGTVPNAVAPAQYLGTLFAGITDGAADGAGQISWSFSVADGVLDHLRAGKMLVQTYQLNVTDGSNAAIQQLISVTLAGTNDAPVITGYSAPMAVLEDANPITTTGTLTVTDVDVKDVVTAAIVGDAVVGGTGGPGSLTTGQLNGLFSLMSPAVIGAAGTSGTVNWTFNAASGSFEHLDDGESLTLTYTIRVTDDFGVPATADQQVVITITGSNDAPVVVGAAVTRAEDTAHTVTLADLGYSDVDGDALVSISIGAVTGGVLTLEGMAISGPVPLAGILAGALVFTPTANLSGTGAGSFAFTANDGTVDSATATVTFDLTAVADAPSLTVTATASGNEDSAIALDIAAALADLDGSEALSVTLSGVPTGAMLSAGTNNGDGTWTLAAAQLAGLTITPPANSDADFTLSVTATATEGSGGDTATTLAQTIAVTVAAVADAPSLTVTATASGNEDSAIALDIAAALADADLSETLSVTLSGVPAGAVLSAGTDNGDGTWTLAAAQLAGLTITPPANSSDAFTLSVTATATEGSGGDTATTLAQTIAVTVAAVNDAPTATAPATATVAEGDAASVLITGISVADVDAGLGSVTVTLSVPAGTGSLTVGSQIGVLAVANGTGSVVLTGTLADINTLLAAGVTYAVPDGDFNTDLNDGAVTLTIGVADGGNTGSGGGLTGSASVAITVTPTVDVPVIDVSALIAGTHAEAVDAAAPIPTLVAAGVTVSDADGVDFAGGVLSVGVTGGDMTDVLGFGPAVTVAGSDVRIGTTTVGTVTGLGTATLTVTLAAGAMAADVQVLVQALSYATTDNTPAASRSITIGLTDGDGGTAATQTVTVTITAANDSPTAVANSFALSENSLGLFNVLVNDTDPEGNALSATLLSDSVDTAVTSGGRTLTLGAPGVPAAVGSGTPGTLVTDLGATVTLQQNGQLIYDMVSSSNLLAFNRLGADDTIIDSFSYTIADGNGGTSTGTVQVTISGVNDPVDAINDTISATEGGVSTGSITGNDIDIDVGDSFQVTSITPGTNVASVVTTVQTYTITLTSGAVITLNRDGTYSLNLEALDGGETAAGSFSYVVQDTGGSTDVATVTLSLTGVNDAPTVAVELADQGAAEGCGVQLCGAGWHLCRCRCGRHAGSVGHRPAGLAGV